MSRYPARRARLLTYLRATTPDEQQDILTRVLEAASTPAWSTDAPEEIVRVESAVWPQGLPEGEFGSRDDWEAVLTAFEPGVHAYAERLAKASDSDTVERWLSVHTTVELTVGEYLRDLGLPTPTTTRPDIRNTASMAVSQVLETAVVRAQDAEYYRDHIHQAHYDVLVDALYPDGYGDFRREYESSEDHQIEEWRLLAQDWEPVDNLPGRIDEPFAVRCVRCAAVRPLTFADAALTGTPACDHAGAKPPPLTPEQRRHRDTAKAGLEDQLREEETQAAGWEQVEPRPARRSSPWLLRCTTCGEQAYARVSHQEHTTPCPHQPTAAEQRTQTKWSQAGWTVTDRPIRGARNQMWGLTCTTCGRETQRRAPVGTKKATPCTHPAQEKKEEA